MGRGQLGAGRAPGLLGRERGLPRRWWRQAGHGRHQILHLGSQQRLAIATADLIQLIAGWRHPVLRIGKPAIYGHLVIRANQRDNQIFITLLEPELIGLNTIHKSQGIVAARILVKNGIAAIPFPEEIGIVSESTIELIVAGIPCQ